jgi:hypothetical protein
VGKGGLTEAGRAVEEYVVQRLVALERGLDGDPEVILQLLLADELIEAPGTKSRVQGIVVVRLDFAGDDAVFGRRNGCLSNTRSTPAIIGVGSESSRDESGAYC